MEIPNGLLLGELAAEDRGRADIGAGLVERGYICGDGERRI